MGNPVTERDIRLPEFRDADLADLEFDGEGKVARKDRWEMGIRAIAGALGIRKFDIPQVATGITLLIHACRDRAAYLNWETHSDDDVRLDLIERYGPSHAEIERAIDRKISDALLIANGRKLLEKSDD